MTSAYKGIHTKFPTIYITLNIFMQISLLQPYKITIHSTLWFPYYLHMQETFTCLDKHHQKCRTKNRIKAYLAQNRTDKLQS